MLRLLFRLLEFLSSHQQHTANPVAVTLLIKNGGGDAQGCIMAMESCSALAAAFAACGDDLGRVPAAFTRARAPDAHAVQDLELMQARTVPIVFWRPTTMKCNMR